MKSHLFFIRAIVFLVIVMLGASFLDVYGEESSFSGGRITGTVESGEITEASGMAAGRMLPLLWVHNDSGDTARIFGISTSGDLVCTCRLQGIETVDWEDMAIGPGPKSGIDYLYLADIGDNRRKRKFVTIYRIPEPAAASGDVLIPSEDITALNFTYPDGPHNAETIFSDPITGDLFIVTKKKDGNSKIFRYPFAKQGKSSVRVEPIAMLKFGTGDLPGSPLATGGDISPSGEEIILKTYDHAFLWRRDGKNIAETFLTRPSSIPLKEELQGEAICFSRDGLSYFTLSEGVHQPLWCYERK